LFLLAEATEHEFKSAVELVSSNVCSPFRQFLNNIRRSRRTTGNMPLATGGAVADTDTAALFALKTLTDFYQRSTGKSGVPAN